MVRVNFQLSYNICIKLFEKIHRGPLDFWLNERMVDQHVRAVQKFGQPFGFSIIPTERH